MGLRNSNGIGLRAFTLQPYGSFFRKFSPEVKKMQNVEINSGASKSSKQKIILYV